MRRLFDWLHGRTGYRHAVRFMLDEPLPPGTGWFFTLGSLLLALLSVQLLTGAVLTLFYAPTPDHAWDSVRFISSTGPGRLVRGLHHFGASFLVVAVALHLLRVVAFGSYKPPREITWLSGLVLLLLVLGFALTGYLLPWDQRAYWATVVTINISKLAPAGGDLVAGVMQGGATVGALTLTRWYSAHVIFLPALLAGLIVLHVAMMRRHGISGPVRTRPGGPTPFYPAQAARDVTVAVVVLGALALVAWLVDVPLEGPADPTDASYIPRPEWYFLGLFQLLKYFPGRWEVVGAIVLPTLVLLALAALPWIDRGPSREPGRRLAVLSAVLVGVISLGVLTALGWRDRPASAVARDQWNLREIGGRLLAGEAGCARCHSDEGMADPLERLPSTRGPDWVSAHVVDPEMIAPGLREPTTPMNEREVAAILAYVQRLGRQPYPGYDAATEAAARVFARHCIGCHRIDGDGGTDGPDLTRIGTKHRAAQLRTWITDPKSVDPDAEMPSFGKRLTPAELDAIATYLSKRGL